MAHETGFDVASCFEASRRGQTGLWVSRYLDAGPWANPGLRDGLLRQERYWLGPLLVPIDRLQRCCGPEPAIEFPVPVDGWERKVSQIAASIAQIEQLPPLIVEWTADTLSIRDGNHRHAALMQAGYRTAWIILWCNDLTGYKAARLAMTSGEF